MYQELSNFQVINEPTTINHIPGGALLCPFLFHHEYNLLNDYDCDYVYGHFEFNGFIVTGNHVEFKGGPEATDYRKFKQIFSGHFHKRQHKGNVIYIGNTFPMDFSDANDNARGFCIHNQITNTVEYHQWADAPKYITTTLSKLLEDGNILSDGVNVKCVADIELTYEEMLNVKKTLTATYNLNELTIKEQALVYDTEVQDNQLDSTKTIIQMLQSIDTPNIDTALLINIFTKLD
jgi:DNA repair exonuclease SbcCD nuclease subunit